MTNNFEMVGKLSIGRESEKFKPYKEDVFEGKSKMKVRTLNFQVIAANSRHFLQSKELCFDDGKIFTFSKGTMDADGNYTKGKSLIIPFKDRLKSENVAKVAEFKKLIVDLEVKGRRVKLNELINKYKNGDDITEKELKEVCITDPKDLEFTLEKSNELRHEFISRWDFTEFLYKMIKSDEYKDKKFFIKGEYVPQWSDKDGRFYVNYVPTKIYLANDDAKEMSRMTLDFFYNRESLNDDSLAETGKYYVNGYIFAYDKVRKTDIPCPYTISLLSFDENASEKEQKIAGIRVKRFEVDEDDDTVYQLGIVVDLINGSELKEISEEDLTEEQQDALLCGDITMEEIIAETGGKVYGDKIIENRFAKLKEGYSKGREATALTEYNLSVTPLESKEEIDEEEELFKDDEDDEL